MTRLYGHNIIPNNRKDYKQSKKKTIGKTKAVTIAKVRVESIVKAKTKTINKIEIEIIDQAKSKNKDIIGKTNSISKTETTKRS